MYYSHFSTIAPAATFVKDPSEIMFVSPRNCATKRPHTDGWELAELELAVPGGLIGSNHEILAPVTSVLTTGVLTYWTFLVFRRRAE